MNIKGFILTEVLVGLFLLGLITVICLPILCNASYNLQLTKDKVEMLFIAESVIEQIKSFDYGMGNEDQQLFDMPLIELIEMLGEEASVTAELAIDAKTNNRYLCTIYKKACSEQLWEVQVEVSPYGGEKRISNVKIKAYVQVPSEDNIS